MIRLTIYCGTLPVGSERLWGIYESGSEAPLRHVLRLEYGTRRWPNSDGWLSWRHAGNTWTATLEKECNTADVP